MAVPLLAPAVLVLIPTTRLLLSVTWAPSKLNAPLAVASPVTPPILAFRDSEKPSLAAVLVIDKFWVTISPTWESPSVTGSGLCAPACARRNTCPVTATSCDGSGVMPKPLLPVPSDSKSMVALPALLPAVVVSIETVIELLSVAPGPSRAKLPPLLSTPPVLPAA